jgi:hypothetical protein
MIVYWIDPVKFEANFEIFEDKPEQLTEVLNRYMELCKAGMHFVTSASETSGGGGIVRDGKLPNGEPYTWKKRRP